MMNTSRTSALRRMVAVAVAALALGAVSSALAQGQITDEQARRIALEHVPGTVLDLEREDDDGVPTIEVEVRGEDGRVHEVEIDARDGRVLAVEAEDEGDDDDQD